MFNSRFIRVYIIPGAVFQSVVMAGGYGTGREVTEYISRHGAWAGLLGILIAAVTFGIVMSLTYEFARVVKQYDYRNFFKELLGPLWFCYEILFMVTLLLTMAVIAAASGTILYESFDIPKLVGVGILLVAVIGFSLFGRELINKSLTLWAFLVMVVLLVFFVHTVSGNFDSIKMAFAESAFDTNWSFNGFQFAIYNTLSIPALLYSTTAISSRKESMGAGMIGGFIVVTPAVLYHLSFMSNYPAIINEELPVYWMLQHENIPWLLAFYLIVLLGTMIQTGVGMLQGLKERLDAWRLEVHGRKFQPITHAAIAGTSLLISAALSSFGVIALVAQGYAALGWGLLVVYAIPLLTIGVYKSFAAKRAICLSSEAN